MAADHMQSANRDKIPKKRIVKKEGLRESVRMRAIEYFCEFAVSSLALNTFRITSVACAIALYPVEPWPDFVLHIAYFCDLAANIVAFRWYARDFHAETPSKMAIVLQQKGESQERRQADN
jgi:hypothetical protein